jgi:hypothetical protein
LWLQTGSLLAPPFGYKEKLILKKITLTLLALFALSSAVIAFADDTAKTDNKNEITNDTSHNPLTGKDTHTRKHKRHHKRKNADGSQTTTESTTTEKTTTPDNK